MRRASARLGLIAFCFAIVSCSEPPTKEHDQAIAAIRAAEQAGAAPLAASDLAEARAALAKYDALVADRDYKQALASAIDARDHAYAAAATAAQRRAQLKQDIEAGSTGLVVLLHTADTRLAAAGRRAPALSARVRQSRRAAQQALQNSRTTVADAQLEHVLAELTAATTALKDDVALLDAAIKRGAS